MNRVVERIEEITPAWITQALQAGGHHFRVSEVTSKPIGAGQMGATHRLQLKYDGPSGPSKLIAKIACEDADNRRKVAMGYRAEVGFYQHIAARVQVRTPQCWHVAIQDDGHFTLLLDDMAPAIPGVQVQGCTVAQAEAAIANLVGLHAPTWNDPTLRDFDFLMRTNEIVSYMGKILAPATDVFLERYRDQLDGEDARVLRAVAEAITQWRSPETEPFAVIHGDYRLDNLLFAPDGGVIGIDWQSAAMGPPLRDVAFFLGTGLEPDARRTNEEALVASYHSALTTSGVAGYDSDQCWREYRLGQFQGPMVTVIGCAYATGERTQESDAMFLAMARRSCAAIRELRSLELL